MQETATKLLESKLPWFLERFRADILDADDFRGDLKIAVGPARIRDMVHYLKTNAHCPFEVLMDLFGVDYMKFDPPTPERFAVIYNFYSLSHKRRVYLKAFVSETRCEIDSVHDIYKMANWFEREAWDLFGIVFTGHPNLIRILCHSEFEGHALRKDYPADYYQRLKAPVTSSGL